MKVTNLDPKDYTALYLNGHFVPAISEKVYSLCNPKDNSIVADRIPIAGLEDIDAAVAHAEAAFPGPWSQFTALQRTECLLKLAALLGDELVSILTLDSLTAGNPVSLIPTRERNYIRNCLLYYAGWTDRQKGDYFPADDGNPNSVALNAITSLSVSAFMASYLLPFSLLLYRRIEAIKDPGKELP